jgi:hypothetical protein
LRFIPQNLVIRIHRVYNKIQESSQFKLAVPRPKAR